MQKTLDCSSQNLPNQEGAGHDRQALNLSLLSMCVRVSVEYVGPRYIEGGRHESIHCYIDNIKDNPAESLCMNTLLVLTPSRFVNIMGSSPP